MSIDDFDYPADMGFRIGIEAHAEGCYDHGDPRDCPCGRFARADRQSAAQMREIADGGLRPDALGVQLHLQKIVDAREAKRIDDEALAAALRPLAERCPEPDWADLFGREREAPDWLAGKLLQQGELASFLGGGKVGKSLFLLHWAICVANGLPFLGDTARRPRRVLYLDRENPVDDVVDRARCLGYGAEHLGALSYRPFPELSGQLDESDAACADVLAMVDGTGAEVLIVDTASRFVGGNENDSSTWLALYSRLAVHLKARGVTTVRIDHTGKDASKGGRGSSAKGQDVDTEWTMTAQPLGTAAGAPREGREVSAFSTALTLEKTYTRRGVGADRLSIVRTAEKFAHRVSDLDDLWLAGATSHAVGAPVVPALEEVDVPEANLLFETGREMSCREIDLALDGDGSRGSKLKRQRALEEQIEMGLLLKRIGEDGKTVLYRVTE